MEYRPPDYKNPYQEHVDYEKSQDLSIIEMSRVQFEWKKLGAYELGYSDAGEHILSLLKEKAPSSVIIDILEQRKW